MGPAQGGGVRLDNLVVIPEKTIWTETENAPVITISALASHPVPGPEDPSVADAWRHILAIADATRQPE